MAQFLAIEEQGVRDFAEGSQSVTQRAWCRQGHAQSHRVRQELAGVEHVLGTVHPSQVHPLEVRGGGEHEELGRREQRVAMTGVRARDVEQHGVRGRVAPALDRLERAAGAVDPHPVDAVRHRGGPVDRGDEKDRQGAGGVDGGRGQRLRRHEFLHGTNGNDLRRRPVQSRCRARDGIRADGLLRA